jgi:putative flippase GtrA
VSLRAQVVRYCAVGVVNTLVSLGLDAMLLAAGAPLLVASACAFAAGAATGYALNRRWTFAARASAAAGGVYAAVTLAGLGLDTVLVHVLHGAGASAFAAFVLALPLVTLATFVANRRLTFREPLPTESYV